jgi:acyl carrier protein
MLQLIKDLSSTTGMAANVAIRRMWSEELDVADISDEDDFFSLGGDSLVMVKIQARIEREMGVAVPMEELFRQSTVKAISAYIARARAA